MLEAVRWAKAIRCKLVTDQWAVWRCSSSILLRLVLISLWRFHCLSSVDNYLALQDNEFELVFVLGYQKMLALAYLDKVKQFTIKSEQKSLNI